MIQNRVMTMKEINKSLLLAVVVVGRTNVVTGLFFCFFHGHYQEITDPDLRVRVGSMRNFLRESFRFDTFDYRHSIFEVKHPGNFLNVSSSCTSSHGKKERKKEKNKKKYRIKEYESYASIK